MENVIKYITENKDWIFSGVGITVIGVAYKGMKFIFESKDRKDSNPIRSNEGIYNGKIDGTNNTINNTINFNSPINKIDNSNDILKEANGLYEKKNYKEALIHYKNVIAQISSKSDPDTYAYTKNGIGSTYIKLS